MSQDESMPIVKKPSHSLPEGNGKQASKGASKLAKSERGSEQESKQKASKKALSNQSIENSGQCIIKIS